MTSPYLVNADPYDGRSKNARAQARHREKRKAYVRTLEDTLSRLQVALGLPFDQASNLPSPLSRIRDLERENQRLRAELQSLRRHITEGLHHSNGPYDSAYLLNGHKRFRATGELQSPLVQDTVTSMPLNPIRLDNNLSAERMPCLPYPPSDLTDHTETPVSYSSATSFPPPAYPYNGYVSPDSAETVHTSRNHSPASPAASTFTKDDELDAQLTVTTQAPLLPPAYHAIPLPQPSACAVSYNHWSQIPERRTVQFSA